MIRGIILEHNNLKKTISRGITCHIKSGREKVAQAEKSLI